MHMKKLRTTQVKTRQCKNVTMWKQSCADHLLPYVINVPILRMNVFVHECRPYYGTRRGVNTRRLNYQALLLRHSGLPC